MALIDKETIRAEIERYKQGAAIARFDNAGENADYFQGKVDLCDDLTHILDTLPEQPELKPMNIPSAGGGMSTTPPSYKLDVKPEQPVMDCHGLDNHTIMEEIRKCGCNPNEFDVARHFYELGCTRTAVMYDDIEYERQRAEEAELSGDLEEEIKKFIEEYGYERGGDKLLIAIVARHFAEWGAEHLKR